MKHQGVIKVLIVDDSALVRSVLRQVLSGKEGIEVVGGAKDPFEAREFIITHRPDVIILDVEMPRMDGLTFLRKLQVHYPVPVIMCSSLTPANSQPALDALEFGAVDVVAKPNSGGSAALRQLGEDLAEKVQAAAQAIRRKPPAPASPPPLPAGCRSQGIDPAQHLVAVGASTGGTEAIRALLARTPADFPPIVITQHMPEGFTHAFAERLNRLSALHVSEAVDGVALSPGMAVVARGGVQMMADGAPGRWRVRLGTDELVNRHCPSVDVLFDSVVRAAGRHAVGILLTGMGADGASGLLRLRQAGAPTIAQNQESCVVYGMPKVAVELGAALVTAAPPDIPPLVVRMLKRPGAAAGSVAVASARS